MEWYEAIRHLRLEKNAADPGEYTGTAAARRAGVPQSVWSRMEVGQPKSKDGSSPKPTVTLLRMASRGLDEPFELICSLCGFPSDSADIPTRRLVHRLYPILKDVSAEKREAVEEALVQVARAMILHAA